MLLIVLGLIVLGLIGLGFQTPEESERMGRELRDMAMFDWFMHHR